MIDCNTCIHASTCERAQASSWCLQWRQHPPVDRGPNPAEMWATGEDPEE